MIDLNLYQYHKFHTDELKNKQIRALIVLCHYEVNRRLQPKLKIDLINHWIKVMIQHELYEVIPYIKELKQQIIKKSKPKKTVIQKIKVYIKIYARLISNWFN